MVVIMDRPLWNAEETRLEAPDMIDENALDAALRTVDQADDADDAMLDQADPATLDSQRNGAPTAEYAVEPSDTTLLHPEETTLVMPSHALRAASRALENA